MYHKLVVCRDYNVIYSGAEGNIDGAIASGLCDHIHVKANCDDYDTALSLLPQLAAIFARDLADNATCYFNFKVEFDDRLVGVGDDLNAIIKIAPDTPVEKFPSGSLVFTINAARDTIEVYKIALESGWLTYYTLPKYVGKFTIVPVEYTVAKAFSPSVIASVAPGVSPSIFNAVLRELEQSLTERNLVQTNKSMKK
ncbi:hypothetical protein F-S17_0096 [Faustovirus]|nr:hypothetical protein F-M6_0111 [Faustovirus]QJX72362.1 hypothetical protein F-S17_0096 [Faustovirus]QJX73886.1 hypothetical protein F-E9_113 [Faustovirus]